MRARERERERERVKGGGSKKTPEFIFLSHRKKPKIQDAARDSHAAGRPVRQPARDRVLAKGEGRASCVHCTSDVERGGPRPCGGLMNGMASSSFLLLLRRRRPSSKTRLRFASSHSYTLTRVHALILPQSQTNSSVMSTVSGRTASCSTRRR